MIRRPLNERFADKVLAGIKTTTIRDNAWPIGKPIMLFRWEGKPYRSKQVNIAAVIVELAFTIAIRRIYIDQIKYLPEGLAPDGKRPLWQTEGFDSQMDMDTWFCHVVPVQGSQFKSLMRFRLATEEERGAA